MEQEINNKKATEKATEHCNNSCKIGTLGITGEWVQGWALSQSARLKLWMDLTTISLPKVESELESRLLHFPFTPPLDYEEIVRYNTR